MSARRSSAEDGAERFTPTPRLPSGRSSPVDEVADRRRSLGDGGRGLEVCHGLSSANTPVSARGLRCRRGIGWAGRAGVIPLCSLEMGHPFGDLD